MLVGLGFCAGAAHADFNLRYVDHTGIEIAMAWDPVSDATAYLVQRDTASTFNTPNLVSYTIDPSVTGFGDTGWPLDDSRRFGWRSTPADSPTYHLDPGPNLSSRPRHCILLPRDRADPRRAANL